MTHQEADVYALVVGKAIALLREHCQLTQNQLAESVGMTQSTLSRIERGQAQPDTFGLHKIAAAFGMKSSEFDQLIEDVCLRTAGATRGALRRDNVGPWWQTGLAMVGIVGMSAIVTFATMAALSERQAASASIQHSPSGRAPGVGAGIT